MADYTKLEDLVAAVLEEMRRLKYSEQTITGFRRSYNSFTKFAAERGEEEFSENLATEFLNYKFETPISHLYQSNPKGRYIKHWLRGMRMLMEFQECGCICKRMPGELRRTPLPPGLQVLVDSFNDASRRSGPR